MTLRFSLREHKDTAAYNPNFSWSKPSGSILRQSSTSASLGYGYVFISVPRVWLHGKYIRFYWRGVYTWGSFSTVASIYDGSYDRSSDVDFPSGSGRLIKGNGLLQTLRSKTGSFAWETADVQANVSGGNQAYCTIFLEFKDGWIAQSGYMEVDWFEINSGSGGAGNLASEPFDSAITMEVTGTTNDYGYISSGAPNYDDFADLKTIFGISNWSDLPAEFIVAQWQEDLFAKFIARPPWVDLRSIFIVRHSVSAALICEFFVDQYNASADLKVVIWVYNPLDLSRSRGISFMWWGSGGPDQMIDFEMTSPTGAWIAKFYDGPAEWHWVFLSWEELTEVDLDGTRPDRSRINGIYWTYHTSGLRRVDRISAYSCADLKAVFNVRQAAIGEALKITFLPRLSTSADLKGIFDITHNIDLKAIFTIPYDVSDDIPCEFMVRQPGSQNLRAIMVIAHWEDLKCEFTVT